MSHNIFGKRLEDYQHLAEAPANLRDRMIRDAKNNGMPYNFRVSDWKNPNASRVALRDQLGESVNFITNNLQSIQAEIKEIMYLDFRLPEYIPIKTDIPEGARTYSYRVVDHTGRGQFIENMGTNVSTAGVTMQNVPYNIDLGGILAQWSIEDLRAAQLGGIPLDTETIKAATEGAMDHIEQVGLGTAGTDRFQGLTNLSGVTTDTAAVQWPTLTPQELISAVQAQISNVVTQSNEIFGRRIKRKMAIYASVERVDLLHNTLLDTIGSRSVWEYVKTNNLWTQLTGFELELRDVLELSTAGAGGTQRVLFGFPESDDVWEMAMPIAPRVINTIQQPFYVQAPLEYKISGVNVKLPGGLRYVDDV